MEGSNRVTDHTSVDNDFRHPICEYFYIGPTQYLSAFENSFLNRPGGMPFTSHVYFIILFCIYRLVKHGRHAEALAVISALDNKDFTDNEVQRTYIAIHEAVVIEAGTDLDDNSKTESSSNLKELFTNGRQQNFRRAALGVVIQCFQQITGINLIT